MGKAATERELQRFKVGDVVICVDDDSEDEDLGMSGHVLYGRRDLRVGKEYIVESINDRCVPEDPSHWTDEEWPFIKEYWQMLKLKGIGQEAWAHLFVQKKKDSSYQVLTKKDFKS